MAYLQKLNKKKRKGSVVYESRKIDTPPPDSVYRGSSENYKIKRKLGSGSTGEVNLVEDKKTGVEYAQKKIPICQDEEKNRPLFGELNVLMNIDSPFIVKLGACFQEDFHMFMLIEYMNLGSLYDVIKKLREKHQKAPEEIIAQISEKILRGLLYIHKKEFIHRDIKPANILINTSGDVKIADFGMAGIKKVTNTTFLGTGQYLSPERFYGNPHSYNTDCWSFGLTISYLTLLKFPFEVSNDWDIYTIMEDLKNGAKTLPDSFSPDFLDFMDCSMKYNLKERWEAQDLLEHRFITENMKKKDKISLKEWLNKLFF